MLRSLLSVCYFKVEKFLDRKPGFIVRYLVYDSKKSVRLSASTLCEYDYWICVVSLCILKCILPFVLPCVMSVHSRNFMKFHFRWIRNATSYVSHSINYIYLLVLYPVINSKQPIGKHLIYVI